VIFAIAAFFLSSVFKDKVPKADFAAFRGLNWAHGTEKQYALKLNAAGWR
jgi:hypothetical protein